MSLCFEDRVLLNLRVFGPCSCAHLARKMQADRETVYRALYHLDTRGLVQHPQRASYDVSPKGRNLCAVLSRKEAALPFKDETHVTAHAG
jgi:DNA-binding IclR family transcriptional regulator